MLVHTDMLEQTAESSAYSRALFGDIDGLMVPVLARPPAGNPAGFGEPGGVAQEFRLNSSSVVRNDVARSGSCFATPGGAFD